MTFKTLSNIIKKYKEQPTQLARQQEQEIAEAQAIINTLRANHCIAYYEREAKWEQDHQAKNSMKGQRKTIEETAPLTNGSGTFLKEHMLASLLKLSTNLNETSDIDNSRLNKLRIVCKIFKSIVII